MIDSTTDQPSSGTEEVGRKTEATLSKSEIPFQSVVLSELPNSRRVILLAIFCLALFTDAFMTSGMIVCLNSFSWSDLGTNRIQAGRVSDVYNPKPVFIAGFLLLGVLGLGAGFVKNIIALIVLRAFQGMGAAMTIPSATAMLTSVYMTPLAKGLALTVFAGAGTLGLCCGFVVGGLMVQFATWRWVLWIVPMITFPLSTISIFLIPGSEVTTDNGKRKMDFLGVSVLTGSIILSIFSLSQAPSIGWGTTGVLLPLTISILGFCLFFFWQTRLDKNQALIPPKMWFIPNFFVLVLVSLCTQIYLTGPILIFSVYWPAVYGWSPFKIGMHSLPMGVTAVIVCIVLPGYILKLPPKIALVAATSMSAIFSILLVFANSRDRYWSYTFPSMILITLGSTAAYMISNVGIITSVPPNSVGVASAIFSAAQQVGGAINVAVITTIFVQYKHILETKMKQEAVIPSNYNASGPYVTGFRYSCSGIGAGGTLPDLGLGDGFSDSRTATEMDMRGEAGSRRHAGDQVSFLGLVNLSPHRAEGRLGNGRVWNKFELHIFYLEQFPIRRVSVKRTSKVTAFGGGETSSEKNVNRNCVRDSRKGDDAPGAA
ncbi:hypothetical protein GALMADRAFT_282590 [Galerina marginata CBS 339.88]|uniref:Major facilitator superfamily (MFS) profile domain-containing protein n=1 Tax=Galerina marginata (strain CBS 339.88) TaxID=685588 RepID=A0A067SFG2_GALM3|nr:hypothetical protein GALMADRAFT_282590 [Galerina marginata CBS 339.88]